MGASSWRRRRRVLRWKYKARPRKPYELAIVVRILGHTVRDTTLCTRLKSKTIWNRAKPFKVIDPRKEFFLVLSCPVFYYNWLFLCSSGWTYYWINYVVLLQFLSYCRTTLNFFFINSYLLGIFRYILSIWMM